MTEPDGSGVVRKHVRVQTPIEQAFSVFVERMETWWPAEHHIGAKPFASIFVEPRAGGRWFERDADGEVCEWGRVLVWEPPHRVTFSWHLGVDWKFDPSLERASEGALRFIEELIYGELDTVLARPRNGRRTPDYLPSIAIATMMAW